MSSVDTTKSKNVRLGLLTVYTGNGKGKTTAALGLIPRGLGRDMKLAVVQFIKGKWKTGERKYLETLDGVEFRVMGEGFTWESDDLSRDKLSAEKAWDTSREFILGGKHDIVILDELTYAINYGFVSVDDVIAACKERPEHVHVVITGRKAPAALIDAADLVTEMNSIKHPFSQGVPAQLGLDY